LFKSSDTFAYIIGACGAAFVGLLGTAAAYPAFGSFIVPWSGFIGTFLGAIVGFAALGWAALHNAERARDLDKERHDRRVEAAREAIMEDVMARIRIVRIIVINLTAQYSTVLRRIHDLIANETWSEDEIKRTLSGVDWGALEDMSDYYPAIGRLPNDVQSPLLNLIATQSNVSRAVRFSLHDEKPHTAEDVRNLLALIDAQYRRAGVVGRLLWVQTCTESFRGGVVVSRTAQTR